MTDSSGWPPSVPAAPVDPYATPGQTAAGHGAQPPYGAQPSYGAQPPYAAQPGYAAQPPYAAQHPYAAPAGVGGPRPLRDVSGLGYAVVAVAGLWLLLDVLEAVTAVGAAPRFAAAAEQGLQQPLVAYDGVVLGAGVVSLVAFVLTGLWLTAVRRNVDRVAPGSQRRGVVWAWLGWFVPVVSLWFPYQVVSDAGRASTRARLPYGAWWALFLGFVVVQRVTGQMVGGVTGDVDPGLVRALPAAEAASALLLGGAFVLWARTVLAVSRAHARWAATQQPTLG